MLPKHVTGRSSPARAGLAPCRRLVALQTHATETSACESHFPRFIISHLRRNP
jgi:hypothetical protein